MAISPALLGIFLILPRVKHGAGLLQRTTKYASLLRTSEALHLAFFEQPRKDDFFSWLSSLDNGGPEKVPGKTMRE
jgi:hypothetical protein